jgi:hypothetical protein
MIGRNPLASPQQRASFPSSAEKLVGPELPPEETLIADVRAGLTPSQMVERKLISLLKGRAFRMSHVEMRRSRLGLRL